MILNLEVSKKFYNARMVFDCEKIWWHPCGENGKKNPEVVIKTEKTMGRFLCPAPDIANDILIKYVREVFGEKPVDPAMGGYYLNYKYCSQIILSMLQQGKPTDEVSEYVWDNCVFSKTPHLPPIKGKMKCN